MEFPTMLQQISAFPCTHQARSLGSSCSSTTLFLTDVFNRQRCTHRGTRRHPLKGHENQFWIHPTIDLTYWSVGPVGCFPIEPFWCGLCGTGPTLSWADWGADKMSWNAICQPSVHYPKQHFLLSLAWRLSFVSQLSAGQNSSACILFLVCIYNAVATEAGTISLHLSCYLVSVMGLDFSDHSQLLHSHILSLHLGSN